MTQNGVNEHHRKRGMKCVQASRNLGHVDAHIVGDEPALESRKNDLGFRCDTLERSARLLLEQHSVEGFFGVDSQL